MKKNKELRISLYCIIFLCTFIFGNFRYFNHKQTLINLNDEKIGIITLEQAGYWFLNGTVIDIDDNVPGKNWSYHASTYSWCSGSGTWNNPYLIENVTLIDGQFRILNSNVTFKIRNCTISPLWHGVEGIYLSNVDNGIFINNNFSNAYLGIELSNSNNNTFYRNNILNNDGGMDVVGDFNNISGNIMSNRFRGLEIRGLNNTVSGNSFNSTSSGIWMWSVKDFSDNNTFSGNNFTNCGLYIYDNYLREELVNNNIIDSTNLVNGKNLYYYVSKNNLDASSFSNAGQIILLDCNNSIISNQNITNTLDGYSFLYSNDNTIRDCVGSYNKDNGLYLRSSNGNTILGNDFSNNEGPHSGIYMRGSDNNNITGNTLNSNSAVGISFYTSNDNAFKGNTVNYNRYGISLYDSNNNSISENSVSYNVDGGIFTSLQKNNSVSRNTITYNYFGLRLGGDNDTALENVVSYNENGIIISGSNSKAIGNTVNNNNHSGFRVFGDNSTISQNIVNDNDKYGIEIMEQCSDSVFSENTLNNNGEFGIYLLPLITEPNNLNFSGNTMNNSGFGMKTGSLEDMSNKLLIDTSNLVNGKPLYYYLDQNNLGANDFIEAGQILLINCNDSIIVNENISYGSIGIALYYSNNNVIFNVTITGNKFHGLYLVNAWNNSITGNNISNNQQYGIYLDLSSNSNLISLNYFSNPLGINAYDNGTNNQWDDGSIGNFWHDYSGKDLDDNGIGDTPYLIPGMAGSMDHFPRWEDGPDVDIPGYNFYVIILVFTIFSAILITKRRNNSKKF